MTPNIHLVLISKRFRLKMTKKELRKVPKQGIDATVQSSLTLKQLTLSNLLFFMRNGDIIHIYLFLCSQARETKRLEAPITLITKRT